MELPSPNKLTDNEKRKLKIVYLAKFAPEKGQISPTFSQSHKNFSAYHFDLYQTLCSLGLEVDPMSNLEEVVPILRDYSYIFSVENSAPFRNSEVLTSAVAECYGLGYLGAPPNIRAMAEDKYLANAFMKSIGIQVPKSVAISRQRPKAKVPPFPGPFIVKARFGVNSEYLLDNCVQDLWSDLDDAYRHLENNGIEAVVEEFIPGRNYGAPFVEGVEPNVMPAVSEVDVGGYNILTSPHKENVNVFNCREILRDEVILSQLQSSNALIRSEIGVCDYFRTDWRVHDETNQAFLIEINICCSIARKSGIAVACNELGWSYEQFLETLLSTSLRREPSSR